MSSLRKYVVFRTTVYILVHLLVIFPASLLAGLSYKQIGWLAVMPTVLSFALLLCIDWMEYLRGVTRFAWAIPRPLLPRFIGAPNDIPTWHWLGAEIETPHGRIGDTLFMALRRERRENDETPAG